MNADIEIAICAINSDFWSISTVLRFHDPFFFKIVFESQFIPALVFSMVFFQFIDSRVSSKGPKLVKKIQKKC